MRRENRGRKKQHVYSQVIYPLILYSLSHHTRVRVLSLKGTRTKHTHRQIWQWEYTHTRMKVHTCRGDAPMQGSGSRLQDQRSWETHQNVAEPPSHSSAERNNRPNEKLTMQRHQSCRSCRPIKQAVWSQFGVNRGRPTLRGSSEGWRGGCGPNLSTALQRNTGSPSNSSPLAFRKVFQQLPSLHSLTPTL